MNRREVVSAIFTISPGILILLLARFSDPIIMDRLTTEDGFVENLSANFYLIGASFCFCRIFFARQKPRYILILWMFLCILFFGEETSWLQRVIGFDTPHGISSTQNEVNIHNLEIFQSIISLPGSNYPILGSQNIFRMGFFLYFIALPLLCGLGIIRITEKYNLHWLPSPKFALSAALIFIITFLFSYSAESHLIKSAIGEIHEFFYAYIIMYYVIEVLRTKTLEFSRDDQRKLLPSEFVATHKAFQNVAFLSNSLSEQKITIYPEGGICSLRGEHELSSSNSLPEAKVENQTDSEACKDKTSAFV